MSKIVVVENLHYAYPVVGAAAEPAWVLRGVTLEIERGSFVSVMGPTGVGKSTLASALNGVVPHATGGKIHGRVIVDGLDTRRHPVPELAQRVGLVFQEPETQFFNLSVEAEVAFGQESLGLPREEIRERIDWALALVGLAGFEDRSPFQLSGGEKQRVALASILAMRPKILVLDEPTASLDPLGKAEVFAVVRSLRERHDATILMVSQDSERVAEFSDRVVVLHEGAVAMAGSPATVFAQAARLREIGLAPPQVSAVAEALNDRLGTRYAFTRLEEAAAALAAGLGSAGGGGP